MVSVVFEASVEENNLLYISWLHREPLQTTPLSKGVGGMNFMLQFFNTSWFPYVFCYTCLLHTTPWTCVFLQCIHSIKNVLAKLKHAMH